MTREEAIRTLRKVQRGVVRGSYIDEVYDIAIEALQNKSRPFGDCSKCIHTYGTLGCCTTVSNEWVYDCEHGMEQYENTSVPPADRPRPIEPTITVDLESGVVPISACEPKGPKTIIYADRPRGEWIDEDGTYYANCSKCGYQMDTHEERGYHNFCPNCGADMRGDTE